MENSDRFLMDEDDSEGWFVASGETWIGPMVKADLLAKLSANEFSWIQFGWRKGAPAWRRLCDIPELQEVVAEPAPPPEAIGEILEATGEHASPAAEPAPPAFTVDEKTPVPTPQESLAEEKIWFLYYNDTQFGPFSFAEVERAVGAGKLHGRVYAWRDGLEDWDYLENLYEFKATLKKQGTGTDTETGQTDRRARGAPQAGEKRTGPRRPLIARILLAHQDAVVVAVCRDISVGGMQVLTDRIPGKVGDKVKMNVSPSGGPATRKMEPFVAEGRIVRLLEDGRGFSFRFENLSARTRRTIEQYIETQDGD